MSKINFIYLVWGTNLMSMVLRFFFCRLAILHQFYINIVIGCFIEHICHQDHAYETLIWSQVPLLKGVHESATNLFVFFLQPKDNEQHFGVIHPIKVCCSWCCNGVRLLVSGVCFWIRVEGESVNRVVDALAWAVRAVREQRLQILICLQDQWAESYLTLHSYWSPHPNSIVDIVNHLSSERLCLLLIS